MAQRAFTVLLVPYVVWLVLAYDYHFIDGVNLAFHEAGHLFMTPFGRWMHFLGGTLGQLVFPVALVVYFLREDKPFEASVCGLWTAESLMYVAWYMADAQAMAIPRVGGGIHDWNWMLSRMGLLPYCKGMAAALHLLASVGAIGALVLAGRAAFGTPTSDARLGEMLAREFPDAADVSGQVGVGSVAPAPPAAPAVPERSDVRGASVFGGPPRR